MSSSPKDDDHGFGRLVRIMDRLRDPGGCPWDREQTLESLEPFLLEETYEVVEAMHGAPEAHCEELGDLLLQIVFQAKLRSEEDAFAIDDVVGGLRDKLVRRHPHVFGEQEARTAEAGLRSWEAAKQAEGKPKGTLAGVPKALPALQRSQRLTEKAARVGFDWPELDPVFDKVREELAEVAEAHERGEGAVRVAAEVGDLLFAVVNLARHLGVDGERALRQASERFSSRFAGVESRLAAQGRGLEEASLEEMDAAWEAAKAAETG